MRRPRIFIFTFIFALVGLAALIAEEESRKGSAQDTSETVYIQSRLSEDTEAGHGIVVKSVKRKFVLLVGVDSYREPDAFPPLQCCANDMNAIEAELIKIGFASEHLQKLTRGDDISKDPNRENIMTAINEIIETAGPNDMIFMAFSGHGCRFEGKDYFCPEDASSGDIPGKSVSLTDLMDRLESESQAKFKWLLVDACRNDHTKSTRGLKEEVIDRVPEGCLMIQSCSRGQKSVEAPNKGHGLFTSFFIEGLQGKADTNDDGVTTVRDICNYTIEQTCLASKNTQRPFISGNTGDFVVYKDGNLRTANRLFLDAQELRESKDYIGAKTKIAEAVRICPEVDKYKGEEKVIDDFLEIAAEKYLIQAQHLRGTGDYAGAREKIEEALKLNPDNEQYIEEKRQIEELLTRRFAAGRTAGELRTLTVNGIDYNFRWCPAGEFMMGSPEDEERRDDDENLHRVKLTRGFWLLETEVTQEMWESVMRTTISEQRDNLWNHPMNNVSWDESNKFCEKLSSLSYETIRLPTEAEWEYACRAGSRTAYFFGDDIEMMPAYGNIADKELKKSNPDEKTISGSDGYAETSPVRSYKPNAWGLYDMHGNVFEWCSDIYDEDYYTSGQFVDPEGPITGSVRVNRGGNWNSGPRVCRSAFRNSNDPSRRYRDLGFRMVLVPASR